jgi:nucleotide-binding universal stress UspA family protein
MTGPAELGGTVLAATDLSDTARGVLPQAVLLASRWAAPLRFVHAAGDQSTEAGRARLEAQLEKAVTDAAFGKDILARALVMPGGPEALVKEAEADGARVVVVGFHKERLSGPKRLGSAMEALLRSLKTDLLVVGPAQAAPYCSVLVAADGEKPFLAGIEAARRYAPEGEVTLVSAVTTEDEVAARRHTLRGPLHQAALTDVSTSVRAGPLAEVLIEEREERGADLIIVQTRGNVLGGVSPTTERLLSERSCDTLCIHVPA